MEGSWTILRTARNGRCALHAVSQVLCRMDVSGIENSTLRNIKNYYKHPELAKRINDLVRTGEFIVNDFNVSNPSIYKDYIMERLRWVKRVVTLVEETLRDNVRGDRLTTTSLIQAAQSQGYRGVDIQAIQNEEAVIFILQENPANPGTNHWIAAIPATRT